MLASQSPQSAPGGLLQIPAIPGTQTTPIVLSLVVPTYNEANNIQAIVVLLSNILDQILPDAYELIVVDDDSPDKTWAIAQQLMANYPQLRVVHRRQERGLSTAVICGWQAAAGDILGVIDGDLQHPPEVLLQLFQAMQTGADLAVASRHIPGGGVSHWSLIRRVLSRGAQIIGLMILPEVLSRVTDPMSGFFLVRRQAIAGYPLNPAGYKVLIEVLGRGQISRVAEVGYVFRERQRGESKVDWRQYTAYLHHLLRLRGSLGLPRLHLWQQPHLPIAKFIQFGVVGLSGVVVDMAILYLLHDPQALGWSLMLSKLIAAEMAIVNNFCWNDRWTFAAVSRLQRGWQFRLKRFLKFNLICLLGLTLNLLCLTILHHLHLNYLLANLLAIAIVTLWNFWMNLKLNWRVTEVKL